MEQKTDNTTVLQVVMLVSGIIRRINEKQLAKEEQARLNKRQPEQCAETGEQQS